MSAKKKSVKSRREPGRQSLTRAEIKAKHAQKARTFFLKGQAAEAAGEDSSAAIWYLKTSQEYAKAGAKTRALMWLRRGKDLQRPESKREMGTTYRGPYPKKRSGPKRSTYGKSVYKLTQRNVRRDPGSRRGLSRSGRDPNDDFSSEAHELLLFLDNDEPLYRRKKEFLRNVHTKMKRGTYSSTLARKLWMYYVEEAAKKYEKEFLNKGEWSKVFPPAVRREVAMELEERERKLIESGEYKDFPPVRTLHDPAVRRDLRPGPGSRRGLSRSSSTLRPKLRREVGPTGATIWHLPNTKQFLYWNGPGSRLKLGPGSRQAPFVAIEHSSANEKYYTRASAEAAVKRFIAS